MAESYESPPTDLMIRRAFEFPWTRRKRLSAWQQWTSQHWDSEPATSAATETIISQQDAGQHVERTPRRNQKGTPAKEERPKLGHRPISPRSAPARCLHRWLRCI